VFTSFLFAYLPIDVIKTENSFILLKIKLIFSYFAISLLVLHVVCTHMAFYVTDYLQFAICFEVCGV